MRQRSGSSRPLRGTSATLAFDFIAGGNTSSNSISISNFVTDGTLGGSGPNSGSSTGTLPGTVTLSETGGTPFFNENLQAITLGATISFQLDATTHFSPTPDAFSFFILDSAGALPILATNAPGGTDALFVQSIDGSANGLVNVYTSAEGVTATLNPVPLPAAISLLFSGLAGAGLFVRRRPTQA